MRDLAEWDLWEVIGQGAHAVVHRAVHPDRPGRVVAVKRLRDVDRAGVTALRDEAAALSDLDHPAIAVLYEVVRDGDQVALVLALATGGTLARRLQDLGPLPPAEVVDLGRRLGSALHAAHAVGILHRDVSPANVLYGREDEPRLGDFGVATAIDVPPDQVVGTATYLDPDVAHGAPPGPASDTWSLSVVLWECLAGQPPWGGKDDQTIRRAADRGDHLPLDALAPSAPSDLMDLLERAISRNPAHRFAHPQELELALARVDLGSSADAPDGPAGQSSRDGVPAPAVGAAAAETPVRGDEPEPDGAGDRDAVGAIPTDRAPDELVDEPPAVAGPGVDDGHDAVDEQARPDPAGSIGGADGEVDGPGFDSSEPEFAAVPADGPGEESGSTTVFGPRPVVEEPAADSVASQTRWLGAAAVLVPLAVAGWVLTVAFGSGTDGPAGSPAVMPTPSAAVASSGSSPSPGPTDTVTPLPSARTPTPAPTPAATPAPVPTPTSVPSASTPSAVPASPAPSSPVVLPAGWTRRAPAPPCGRDRVPVVLPAGNRRLRADVDGSGCTWTLVVGPQQVPDMGRRTVLDVPDGAGPTGGRYDLGPAGEVVVVGDWDGDGIDTVAVVRVASGTVFTFATWDALEGEQIAGPTRRPVVATGPDGRDQVVDAARLPDG